MSVDSKTVCLQCGKSWYPSKDESTAFPGSPCDTGDCLCFACENRDDGDCTFHDELREQERARKRVL